MKRPAGWLLVLAGACAPPPAPPPVPPPVAALPPAPSPAPPPSVVLQARIGDAVRLRRILEPAALALPELLPKDLAWSLAIAGASPELGFWGLTDAASSDLAVGHSIRVSSAAALDAAARAAGLAWSEAERAWISSDGRRRCGVARRAPAEWLVCADRADRVLAIAQVLANVEQPVRAGVHVSFAPNQIVRRLGPGLVQQLAPVVASLLGFESRNVKFDQASGELIRALAAEGSDVFADADAAELRLEPSDDDSVLRLSARLHFAGEASWLSELVEQPMAPTPALFWSLPAGADSAWFFQGLRAARYEPLRASFTRLLYELLDYQGTPTLLRERASALLRDLPLPTVPVVHAAGAIEPVAKPAELAEFQRDLGWHLIGVAEPPDRVAHFLDEWADAYRDDVLGSQLRRVLRSFDERWVPLSLKRRQGAAGRLPRGTQVWELGLPGRRIEPRQGRFVVDRDRPEPLLVFVLARGSETWIAWSGNPAVARERLAALLEPSADNPTLRDRARLQPLRAEGALFGGVYRSELVQLMTAVESRRELEWTASLPSRLLGELFSPASP